MWQTQIAPIEGRRAHRVRLLREGEPLTFGEVLALWRGDAGFRAAFSALLADAPYDAFRWETPPLTATTTHRPFECVLLDCPMLARAVDEGAFAAHFTPASSVVTFPNLGRDATLVAPCPRAAPGIYDHLGHFLRRAPEAQIHALWQAVARAVEARLGPRPLWLSTAGMGVAWLHVRIDDRPKYYGHGPYREERPAG